MQFVHRRCSVRESREKQKKELKKTLDTVGVVRDSALIRSWRVLELNTIFSHCSNTRRSVAALKCQFTFRVKFMVWVRVPDLAVSTSV